MNKIKHTKFIERKQTLRSTLFYSQYKGSSPKINKRSNGGKQINITGPFLNDQQKAKLNIIFLSFKLNLQIKLNLKKKIGQDLGETVRFTDTEIIGHLSKLK